MDALRAFADQFLRNWVDVAVLGIMLLTMLQGWWRGFLAYSLDLLGLVLSFLLALRYYQPVAAEITQRFGVDSPFAKPAAFVAIAAAVGIGFALLAGVLLRTVHPDGQRNPLNRLLGLLPGALNGLLIAAILLTMIVTLPVSARMDAAVARSGLGSELVAAVTTVESQLRPVFGEAIAELLTFQTVAPGAEGTIDLPFEVADATPDPAAEEEMLRLVNAERTAQGLPPLVMDEGLRAVAREHARDMFARGYFSHYSPEGLSPFDRLQSAGIRYLAAGENLALAPTVEVAHEGLMNSPGHRRNILSPDFLRVGIGAMDGGLRGIMFAQEFSN